MRHPARLALIPLAALGVLAVAGGSAGGKLTHALEITGPGLHGPATADISPGQKADLEVVLRDGTYDVFCPVPGHKMLGMNLDIVVSGKGHGGAGASTAASSGSGASS